MKILTPFLADGKSALYVTHVINSLRKFLIFCFKSFFARLVQQSCTQSSGRAARGGKGGKKASESWGQGNPKAFN